MNYAITGKEFLAIMFALEKIHLYLINSKGIIFTDHAIVKHLLKKSNSKPRLMHWVLLLQEFDLDIWDKASLKHVVAGRLSHLALEAAPTKEIPIDGSVPDYHLFTISHRETSWYANLVNFKACGVMLIGLSYQQ